MFELNKDEVVRLITRRHKITLVVSFLPMVVFAFALVLAISLVQIYNPLIWQNYQDVFWFLAPIAGMIIWLQSFGIIIHWLIDSSVITNQRLITIEQYSLFRREVATLQLERVQDVVVEVSGPLEHFFDFGTVIVKTASRTDDFVLTKIPLPIATKELIIKLATERLGAPKNYDQKNSIGAGM